MTVQVPGLHIPTQSRAKGDAVIAITSRRDHDHSGQFTISLDVKFFPPTDDYPTGTIEINYDLSEFEKGTAKADTIDLINSHGRHNPTVFITGKCRVESPEGWVPRGCRYWVMLVDNHARESGRKATPDIVGFVIFGMDDWRVAYGTGPVVKGSFEVDPSVP